ncbi:MAG: ferrous iron transport protein B [Deltaproteobacteria bacterium]|nr:MAG: ferrous iron transport protein B [Deltaproteobacteria bacterium]
MKALSAKTAPAPVRVALLGNPNCGKTTIFNALTGARQKVGNYPGVTVERRQGTCYQGEHCLELVDLPGTYSLTSYSPEEKITQEQVLAGGFDVVVVVVDSTMLGRSLVLLAQAMMVGVPLVLCLNMADEARQAGQQLDLRRMSSLLGMPVVETVGHRGQGIEQLRRAIVAQRTGGEHGHGLVLGRSLREALAAVSARLENLPQLYRGQRAWFALKLLLDEPRFVSLAGELGLQGARDEAARQRAALEVATGMDIGLYVTECFFGFVDGLLREVTLRPARADARSLSDRVDTVLAHRLLGLPIFGAVMFAIFWVTFTAGEIPMGWIEDGFTALGRWLGGLWPAGSESLLRSLLVDGVIGGVGGVVVFLPNILLLFLGLALLEDTGYLARAAFLMDRLMHRFGLHGKSFLPLLVGFGCSLPGIMATRTLENERDRLTTMLVLPLMSCGARLPVWLLLIPAFFPAAWQAPLLWLIYSVGIVLALGLAWLLRRTLFRGAEAPFVMELPPYRLPTLRAVTMKMAERCWLYLRKAGTMILAISILMWFITSYPKPDSEQLRSLPPAGSAAAAGQLERHQAADRLRHSLAGRLGTALEPVFAPLGFDWKLNTALIGAFAAKEVFVAQLGIVYSLGGVDEESPDLRQALRRDYTPLQALALMLFLLIGTPCMATFAITRRESGSIKWALLQLGGLTALAWLVALLVFQGGRLLGLG